jgi:hypothetical protein
MKLKYSLSHLMLIFVIVGLVCLWNIQRKKIDSLTDKLNQTNSALKATVNTGQQYYMTAKAALEKVKEDTNYGTLSRDSKRSIDSLYATIEELGRQSWETELTILRIWSPPK